MQGGNLISKIQSVMIAAGKEKDSEKTKEEFDIRELYTPLSVAKKEIRRRWKDKDLKKKVEELLGGKVPKPFREEPRAVLSRSIITPDTEFFRFLELVKRSKLKPLGLEGVGDKFCTKNYDKASLGKLAFFRKEDLKNSRKKKNNIECKKMVARIIDMEDSDGKRLCDINTLWGENFIDFHHRMLNLHDSEIETFDDFEWLDRQNKRKSPHQYYEIFLLFFICHGILFENIHAKGKEKEFTKDIIVDNYKKIKDTFGCKPLIVPLVPIKDELRLYYWNGYPSA
jgi:hypothetical protein